MISILIPTDFSPASYKALQFANKLAEKNETRLEMIHVYTNDCVNLFPSYRDHAVGIMKRALEEYKLFDLPHRCFVREGEVGDCILRTAREQATSLLIMGRNIVPSDGLKNGTAFRIVQKASFPVLFIPQGISADPITEILYVVNVEQSAEETFATVLQLADRLNAHITYLNILPVSKSGIYRKKISENVIHADQQVSSSFIRANDIYSGIKLYLKDHLANIVAIDSSSEAGLFRKFKKPLVELLLAQFDFPVLFLNGTNFYNKLKASNKNEKKNEYALVS